MIWLLTRVRPMFSTVSGLSAPPPFGANSRSVVVSVDPEKLSRFNISPDQVVEAISKNNAMTPSGNLRVDSMMYVTTVNSLEEKVQEFEDIPINNKWFCFCFYTRCRHSCRCVRMLQWIMHW